MTDVFNTSWRPVNTVRTLGFFYNAVIWQRISGPAWEWDPWLIIPPVSVVFDATVARGICVAAIMR